MASRSRKKARRFSTRFSRSPRVNGPSPRPWAMARRNSPPGKSERQCDEPLRSSVGWPVLDDWQRFESGHIGDRGDMKTALLFDLDGTLVDSDAEHLVAFQRVFAPHGIKLDRSEYAANIMGASK